MIRIGNTLGFRQASKAMFLLSMLLAAAACSQSKGPGDGALDEDAAGDARDGDESDLPPSPCQQLDVRLMDLVTGSFHDAEAAGSYAFFAASYTNCADAIFFPDADCTAECVLSEISLDQGFLKTASGDEILLTFDKVHADPETTDLELAFKEQNFVAYRLNTDQEIVSQCQEMLLFEIEVSYTSNYPEPVRHTITVPYPFVDAHVAVTHVCHDSRLIADISRLDLWSFEPSLMIPGIHWEFGVYLTNMYPEESGPVLTDMHLESLSYRAAADDSVVFDPPIDYGAEPFLTLNPQERISREYNGSQDETPYGISCDTQVYAQAQFTYFIEGETDQQIWTIRSNDFSFVCRN